MAAMHSSGVWTWPPETLLVKAKTYGKVVFPMTFADAQGHVHAPVNPTRVALEMGRSRLNQQSHAILYWRALPNASYAQHAMRGVGHQTPFGARVHWKLTNPSFGRL